MFNILSIVLTGFNWTNFSTDFMNFWMYPYELYLNEMFWPVVFTGVFGLSLLVSKGNIAVATASILFTFGIWGSTETFKASPEFSLLFGLVAIAGFAGTIAMLFIKQHRG